MHHQQNPETHQCPQNQRLTHEAPSDSQIDYLHGEPAVGASHGAPGRADRKVDYKEVLNPEQFEILPNCVICASSWQRRKLCRCTPFSPTSSLPRWSGRMSGIWVAYGKSRGAARPRWGNLPRRFLRSSSHLQQRPNHETTG